MKIDLNRDLVADAKTCEATPEGPWMVRCARIGGGVVMSVREHTRPIVVVNPSSFGVSDEEMKQFDEEADPNGYYLPNPELDAPPEQILRKAEFVAMARTALPDALARLACLREGLLTDVLRRAFGLYVAESGDWEAAAYDVGDVLKCIGLRTEEERAVWLKGKDGAT